MRTGKTALCLLVVATGMAAQVPATRGVSAAWSLPGRWSGVVGDETSGAMYAIRDDGGAEVDVAGQIQREFPLPRWGGRMLRLGRFPQPTLVTFMVWGSDVTAYDRNGNRVWSYPREMGIDDVWAADVDGDESDELIVGYNGGTGVHVVGADGQLRWKSTGIGNVWHVAAADVLGQGRAQVVTTSALGKVHIFSGDGQRRVDVAVPGVYANMVRAQKLRPEDVAATILVSGNDLASKGFVVMALSADGVSKWRLELPGRVVAAQVASSRPLLAVGTGDGQVFVVDAVKGEIVAVVADQGRADVGWVGNPPLLLVATGASLNAFHVTTK